MYQKNQATQAEKNNNATKSVNNTGYNRENQ